MVDRKEGFDVGCGSTCLSAHCCVGIRYRRELQLSHRSSSVCGRRSDCDAHGLSDAIRLQQGWAPGRHLDRCRLRRHRAGARKVACAVTNATPHNIISWASFMLLFGRRMPGTPRDRWIGRLLNLATDATLANCEACRQAVIAQEGTRPNSVTIIHNGIIENYGPLKSELMNRGYEFKSDTDTEVLINLIQEIHKNSESKDMFESVRIALSEVIGAYAIVILDKNNPDQLIAAKMGSPLVVGIEQERSDSRFCCCSKRR